MTAFFFIKKWAVGVLSLVLVASCVLYAGMLYRATPVYLGKSFYFLVRETEHIEAGVLETRLDGGAGYPLYMGGESAVAIAVYLHEDEGYAVQAGLLEQGERVFLIKRGVEHLYFKTAFEKRNASLYTGALESLYGMIQILSQEIARLDKGATQQSCKRILQTLSSLFSHHKKEYDGVYPAYARLCENVQEDLTACVSGTVFTKDLRYLLCEWSAGYLQLAEAFSL